MRRKAGTLVPLEQRICIVASNMMRRGRQTFHGYEIAKALAHGDDARQLTAYGTLYRALGRLEEMGHLASRAENPAIAAREGRPGRRLYSLTATGEEAAKAARLVATAPLKGKRTRKRWAPA